VTLLRPDSLGTCDGTRSLPAGALAAHDARQYPTGGPTPHEEDAQKWLIGA